MIHGLDLSRKPTLASQSKTGVQPASLPPGQADSALPSANSHTYILLITSLHSRRQWRPRSAEALFALPWTRCARFPENVPVSVASSATLTPAYVQFAAE